MNKKKLADGYSALGSWADGEEEQHNWAKARELLEQLVQLKPKDRAIYSKPATQINVDAPTQMVLGWVDDELEQPEDHGKPSAIH